MSENDWLAEQFEAHRPHLRAAAYRMLGSVSEADDAVQEAWLRLSRPPGRRGPRARGAAPGLDRGSRCSWSSRRSIDLTVLDDQPAS